MPQLKTYTADISPAAGIGGRRASAEDFHIATGVGKALGKFAEAQLQDAEEQESRQALVKSSELRAKYARALDDVALNGGDTVKLKENMQEEFAKVGENFQTRKGASSLQLYGSNTELMFDEQANRIKVQRAGAEARLEGHKFLNSASEILRSNPLYLPAAEKDAEAFAETLKNIPPEKRAEIAHGLKQELNMAAAVASARQDPEGTKKRLESGEWNLSPEQREHATQRADSEVRARRADEQYQHAVKEQQIREADGKARDRHFADIMKGSATRPSIMDDADLRPETREHLVFLMEQRAKEVTGQEKKSDPITMRDLWLRIHTDDSDPRKIYNGDAIFDAVKAGKLNTTDANNLNALVANQKDENNRSIGTRISGAVSTVGRAISADPQFTAQSALVAEIQMDYQARVYDKIKQMRESKKDPSSVFALDGPDSVVTRSFVQASIDAAKQRQLDAAPKLPIAKTKEEYDALPNGALYIGPDGKQATKKGKPNGQTVTGKIQ